MLLSAPSILPLVLGGRCWNPSLRGANPREVVLASERSFRLHGASGYRSSESKPLLRRRDVKSVFLKWLQ